MLISSYSVKSEEIKITKETKQDFLQNELINIKIIFNNPYDKESTFEIKEVLPQNINLIDPEKPDGTEIHDGISVIFYRWQLKLKPKEIASVSYSISTKNLGSYGIKPTVLIDKTTNKSYLSNSLQFNVYCKDNNKCGFGENYLNCPKDCGLGIKDGICDYNLDYVCDPDCEIDPDCGINNKNYLIFGLVAIVFILIIFGVRKFLRKNKNS